MRFAKIFAFFVTFCFFLSSGTKAQTNPTPYLLSSAPYSFSGWDATAIANTYPTSMVFHRTGTQDPLLSSATTADYTLAYNLTSGSRINGLGTSGVSFLNITSAGNLGAAVVSLNTLSMKNIKVSWLGGLITQGDGLPTARDYRIRLQYRISTAGAWTDLPGPIEYSSLGKADGHSSSFGPTKLPLSCENQPVVELRWKYYQYAANSGGTRPKLRLDDILISGIPINQMNFIGLNADNEGIAGWNVLNAPSQIGHLIPSPFNAFNNDTAYYQLASRDYSDFDPISTTGMHGTSISNGFTNLSNALSSNSKSINDINIRFNSLNLGPDIGGVDWTLNDSVENRLYRDGNFEILLNNETILFGKIPFLNLRIDYKNPNSPLDDSISGITEFSSVLKYSGNLSSAANSISDAFLSDINFKGLRFLFKSIQAAGQTDFHIGNNRGGFYEIQNALIETGDYALPEFGDTLKICSGDSIILDAGTGKDAYYWNTGETTQSITIKSGGNFSVLLDSAGVYAYSYPLTVIIKSAPYLNIAHLNNSDTICKGETISFYISGIGNNDIVWAYNAVFPNDTIDLNSGLFTLSATISASYVAAGYTLGNNCMVTDTATIFVNENLIPVTLFSNVDTICLGETVQLSAQINTLGDFTSIWFTDAQLTNQLGTGLTMNFPPNSTTTFYVYTLDNNGIMCSSIDSIEVVVKNCVGINDVTHSSSSIKVHPNPSKAYTMVSFHNNINASTLNIYDVTGKRTESYQVGIGTKELLMDLSKYKPGIYFIEFLSSKSIARQKLIVE